MLRREFVVGFLSRSEIELIVMLDFVLTSSLSQSKLGCLCFLSSVNLISLCLKSRTGNPTLLGNCRESVLG